MTITETFRQYRVLGTTEDAPTGGCQCCGRENLKVYVALEPLEGGEIVYMGTTCGARAEKMTVKEIRVEIKAAELAARKAEAEERKAAAAVEDAAFAAWVEATYGVTFKQPADLWDRIEGMTPLSLRQAWRASRS